ncbi:MAG: class I tRNA ligase family protein, partial [Christensenellaceae bacterium]|nr:class I tRNA ligase family protein [Christensenellaceae bacterium]
VNIHGIVRDSQGRKMSKSLGNGIDPLEVIKKHGADALRFSLAVGNSPGSDMRYYDEKVSAAGNFANKIWNASRFVVMNLQDGVDDDLSGAQLDVADKWILSRLNQVIRNVTDNLENFELGLAAQKVYDFIWSEYCDWYIEMAKPRLNGQDEAGKATAKKVLSYVLIRALKLLHPFMPFITEEIYTEMLEAGESIMISDWPVADDALDFPQEEAAMAEIMEVVRSVRNTRAGMNVPPSRKSALIIRTKKPQVVEATKVYLEKLAFANSISVIGEGEAEPADAAGAVVGLGEVFLPLGDLIDVEKELARLAKEKKDLEGEIARANGKLNNEKFTSKAPAKVVEEERAKLVKYTEMLKNVEKRMESVEKLSK